MRAIPERAPASLRPPPAEAVALLSAAVGEAGVGVAVVDGRDGELKVLYANDSFCAVAQWADTPSVGLLLGDAVAVGPALAAAARACETASPQRERLAYRQGSAVVAADVTVSHHVLGGESPYYLILMRDAPDDYTRMAGWLTDERVLAFYEGRDNPFPLERIIAKYSPHVLRLEDVTACIIEQHGVPLGYAQYYPIDSETAAEYDLTSTPDARAECGKVFHYRE